MFSKKNTSDNSIDKVSNQELINQIKTLQFENAELRAIQSAMPDPYYVRDMDYNIILWPLAIAKLTGYSAEEAKKLKCYTMFKACVCPPGSQCPTQQCIKTKQFLKDVAVDVYHKNGATIHTLVSNAGIYDDNGDPIGAVEIVKDNNVIQTSMGNIGEIIKQLEAAARDLTVVVERVGITTDAVNKKSSQSIENVKTGVKAGQSVYDKTEHSIEFAGKIQNNLQTINESIKTSVNKIEALKQKSETIIQFVKIIQDISAKTNLLAINASIEAAHAGESGRGFKVVADGIRELSKNSSESAQQINATIQEIISLIKGSTDSFTVTEDEFESGLKGIAELLSHINEIDRETKVLQDTLVNIENLATSASQLGGEQNSSIVKANDVSQNLEAIAENLTHEFEKVFKAIQHIDMG